jgi:chaperonin GroES
MTVKGESDMVKPDNSICPLGDKVLVRPIKKRDKTPGGIVLPDSARKGSQRGIVLKVGPGRLLDSGTRVDVGVAVGDSIIFRNYLEPDFVSGDEDYMIISESDILATYDYCAHARREDSIKDKLSVPGVAGAEEASAIGTR